MSVFEPFRPSVAALAALTLLVSASALPAIGAEIEKPDRQSWTFAGPFGRFDRAQLQRGFKVYREVCSACHSLHRVAFRNLGDEGGPQFSEGQVKGLAAQYQVQGEPDEHGDVNPRPARPADYFPLVYPNDNAARAANHGAVPPDFSVIAKARGYEVGFPGFVFDVFRQYQEAGPDYIHALIAEGYIDEDKGEKPPEGVSIPEGLHYNKFFPGNAIAMPKPLTDGQVDYPDGTPTTVDQYTKDVASFLMWASEPTLEQRKETGFKTMIFLVVLTVLLYLTKRRVWTAVGAH